MKNIHETIKENSISQDAETSIKKKTWEAPKLKILSVPTKTQGGYFKGGNQDDAFYNPS